jgi:hypothetical protein
MALLTIGDAVRLTGVSRAQLYRYLKAGRISRTPDGFLDTAELLRAGLLLRLSDETPTVSMKHEETPLVSSDVSAVSLTALERLIDVLQRELDETRLQLREAHARETQLLQMLSQMQHQNQRLLDLPRPAPQEAPQDTPGATQGRRRPQRPPPPQRPPQEQPEAQGGDQRGAMRRRIVTSLQEHPEGLTPAEMRTRLGVDKRLADTCLGMLRYGLVQRVGRGRYGAAEPSQTD